MYLTMYLYPYRYLYMYGVSVLIVKQNSFIRFNYTMTQKRKQAPFTTEGPIYNAKRPRSSSVEGSEERSGALPPRVDLTYGQRGAFPGLDERSEDSLFYGPANDGLEYLHMVR